MPTAAVPHPRWTFNRVLLAGALLSQVIAILLYGGGSPRVFLSLEALLLVPAVLLLAGLVLYTEKPWAYAAAMAGSLLMPLVLVVVASHGRIVLDPARGHDYASKVLLLLSAALAAPAGYSGYHRARRNLPHLTLRERVRTGTGIVMLVLVGAAVGALLTDAAVPQLASAEVFDIPARATREASARYFQFDPQEIAIAVGVPTEIRANNGDVALHTFSYTKNGTQFDHELRAGSTTSFVVLFEQPGVVRYWCALHSGGDHTSGMVGTIRVE